MDEVWMKSDVCYEYYNILLVDLLRNISTIIEFYTITCSPPQCNTKILINSLVIFSSTSNK